MSRSRYPGIWLYNRPKKCDSCNKTTEEFYCTPIGQGNWRCKDCHIKLCDSIYGSYTPEEALKSSTDWPDSYPEILPGYFEKKKCDDELEKAFERFGPAKLKVTIKPNRIYHKHARTNPNDPGPYTGDIPVKIGDELIATDPDLEITNLGICKYSHNTLFRKTCADIHTGICKSCVHNYKSKEGESYHLSHPKKPKSYYKSQEEADYEDYYP